MILYIENHTDTNPQTVRINKFSNASEYKINMQNDLLFCTLTNIWKRNSNYIYNSPQTIKYLITNFTKGVAHRYTETYGDIDEITWRRYK